MAEPIVNGTCLWVSLEIVPDADVCGTAEMADAAVSVGVSGQTMTFDGGAGPVTVSIPPGVVTFSADNGTVPTTTFDGSAWQTVVAACTDTEVGCGLTLLQTVLLCRMVWSGPPPAMSRGN